MREEVVPRSGMSSDGADGDEGAPGVRAAGGLEPPPTVLGGGGGDAADGVEPVGEELGEAPRLRFGGGFFGLEGGLAGGGFLPTPLPALLFGGVGVVSGPAEVSDGVATV